MEDASTNLHASLALGQHQRMPMKPFQGGLDAPCCQKSCFQWIFWQKRGAITNPSPIPITEATPTLQTTNETHERHHYQSEYPCSKTGPMCLTIIYRLEVCFELRALRSKRLVEFESPWLRKDPSNLKGRGNCFGQLPATCICVKVGPHDHLQVCFERLVNHLGFKKTLKGRDDTIVSASCQPRVFI